jgi:outer membrane receptor protein involved in Fe transport
VLNVGGTATSGFDFAIAYRHEVPRAGRFRHQLEGQYLRELVVDTSASQLQGVGFYDLGVYPRLKANFSTVWDRKGTSAGLNVRYIHGYQECVDNDCNTPENLAEDARDVAANVTADLFAGHVFKSRAGTTRLTAGVNNLLDQRPALIYIGFDADSDSSTYDFMGRYFYARVSQSF